LFLKAIYVSRNLNPQFFIDKLFLRTPPYKDVKLKHEPSFSDGAIENTWAFRMEIQKVRLCFERVTESKKTQIQSTKCFQSFMK